jgi:hypothetical protein
MFKRLSICFISQNDLLEPNNRFSNKIFVKLFFLFPKLLVHKII